MKREESRLSLYMYVVSELVFVPRKPFLVLGLTNNNMCSNIDIPLKLQADWKRYSSSRKRGGQSSGKLPASFV